MMEPRKPTTIILRGSSAVTLHERFSQVLLDQLTRSRMVTFDPPAVLMTKRETPSLSDLQTRDSSVRKRRKRRSVWSRLGWQQVTRRLSASRPRGFWSFRHKYRWRAGFTSTYRKRGDLCSRLGQRRLLMRTNIQRPTAGQTQLGLHLPAVASRGRGLSKEVVPTKVQLDAQLDDYMSMSKNRLDRQLDDYMSMSKSRLDAELDDYMLMAGQTNLHWD